MKIELETPYKELWRLGYLVTNKENRRNVILYNNKEDRSTTSYARYLYSVSIGELVPEDMEVDHIDDDKTNDVLENLQLLTPDQNMAKRAKGETLISFICPVCGIDFQLTARQSHKNNPSCSRKCGRIKAKWYLLR